MAKGRDKPNNNRRKRGFRLLYLLLSFILIVAAVITSSVFFFRLEKIELTGNERYSNEQILNVAAVQPNANLFLLPRGAIAKRISDTLHYIDEVKIKTHFPTTIVIEIKECIPLAAMKTEEGYWLLDAKGKILEQVEEGVAKDYISVKGLELFAPGEGEMARVNEADELKLHALCALLTALQEHGTAQEVTWIDMTQTVEITMDYMDRFTVRLPLQVEGSAVGEFHDLYSLKVEALGVIISKLDEIDRGIIDLWKDNGYFRPR